MFRAYALLDERQRTRFPLVFCCHLDEAGRALVLTLAESLGITDDVIVTGMVTDLELAALYNAATVLVHPSRYEGFGLPVLEAMQCGTPVVTTTASSLPEVGGDAAVLVDPEDAVAMADAIAAVLGDPDRREEMARAGLVNAGRFTGEALGRATLASYRRTVGGRTVGGSAEPEPAPGSRRLRLAVWAPLPPEQTGISDYTVELLAGLTRHVDVEVFVNEGFLPDIDLMARYRVHEHHSFERRRHQVGFDAVIYQVGGSFFHWYMNDGDGEVPGDRRAPRACPGATCCTPTRSCTATWRASEPSWPTWRATWPCAASTPSSRRGRRRCGRSSSTPTPCSGASWPPAPPLSSTTTAPAGRSWTGTPTPGCAPS